MSPAFGVGNQATKQVFSVPTNVSQGTQRGAIKETQRHPPSFSMGVNVPKETQKEIILIEEGTEDKVCFIPHEISVPQKAQEDVIFIREETQNDVIYIPNGNSVTQSTHELSYGPKERSVSVSHGSQKFNYIPRGNNDSLDEIIMSPRGTSAPQVTQGRPIYLQSPPTDVLSGALDCKRSQTLETPVQRVPTNDVSAQYQQDALFHHLVSLLNVRMCLKIVNSSCTRYIYPSKNSNQIIFLFFIVLLTATVDHDSTNLPYRD